MLGLRASRLWEAAACFSRLEKVPQGSRKDLSSNQRFTLLHLPLKVKYSEFLHGLQQENIAVNRKMLSELAANEPYSFKALVDQVRFMKGQPAQQQRQQQQ